MDPRDSFFPGRRIRVEVTDWRPKHNSEGEKRLRLDLMLPLTDDAVRGVIPSWLLDPLAVASKPDTSLKSMDLDVTLEGVTLEFWDTAQSAERTMLHAAATLQDFSLARAYRDKNSFLALHCNTNLRRSEELLQWADKYEAMWVWVTFTPADPALPSKAHKGAQMTIGDAQAKPYSQE